VLKAKEPHVPVNRPSNATSNDCALAVNLNRRAKSPHQKHSVIYSYRIQVPILFDP